MFRALTTIMFTVSYPNCHALTADYHFCHTQGTLYVAADGTTLYVAAKGTVHAHVHIYFYKQFHTHVRAAFLSAC